MRRFLFAGLTFALLAGSASAQTIYNTTTTKLGHGQITTFSKVPADRAGNPLPNLDELSTMPGKPVMHAYPMCCMLADQPALLSRLPMLDQAMANLVVSVATLNATQVAALDEKKPPDKKDGREPPAPAPIVKLEAKDWDGGCCFTDEFARRWCLIKGCELPGKPAVMRGWVVESEAKKQFFIQDSGNIYCRMPAK
jgi:hypothetical protein